MRKLPERLARPAALLVVGVACVASPLGAQIPQFPGGQTPTPAEALRMAQQNPALARQMLLQSGMSQAEIRARLQAAGISPTALDQLLSGEPLDSAMLGMDQLNALQALGIPEQTPDGVGFVPLDAGIRLPRPPVDSLATPIFGLDVFFRATSVFQPLLTGPVPDSYRIGPGDEMVLVLTGEVELARRLEVTREGFIVIPQVGEVAVANLTFGELRTVLRSRLAESYSGIDRGTTSFNITVSNLRSNQIYVTGEINQPGAYQLSSVATVLNALYAAGGPTELGNMRRVEVRRRTGDLYTLDLYPYLLYGDISGDVILDQGDVVFVPLKGRRVQVVGAVSRPAFYELSADDDLDDVLRAAGGFAPEALRRRITIHRVLHPADRGAGLAFRQAVDLDLRPTTDTTAHAYLGGVLIPPVGLQDGDSIVVDPVPPLERGYYVTIDGMVQSPGRFPWQDGMTIRELMELARGPVAGADLREAEVARMPPERQNGQIAVSLPVPLDSSYLRLRPDGAFSGPPGVPFPPAGSSPEFELEPYDHVLILQQPEYELLQQAAVIGEIAMPGSYTLLTYEDRITDLVERSGGLLSTAYVDGASLIRGRDGIGRIDLDLAAAIDDPEGEANLVLQPGDTLVVPIYSPTVRVEGAVNTPVTVMYREGEGLDYYIENAGGYRDDADEGKISIRYANGRAYTRSSFLFWSSSPEPAPGSVISVPAENPAYRRDWVTILPPILSGLGSVAALIIAVTR